jgi:hypothetical protein
MKTSLSGNTQDTNIFSNTEMNKHTMNYTFTLLERKTTNYLRFIKWILALLFLVQAGKVSAQCGGTWSGGGQLSFGCLINARYIGSSNPSTTDPSGCPGTPVYTTAQTATYTFGAPVSSFKIDFNAFSSTNTCAKMELKINGVHYDLNNATLVSFCSTTGLNLIARDLNGYITGSATSTLNSNGEATILISGVNASTVTISTNDAAGILVSTPYACTVCNAGATAPTLSSTTITNCPVNLNSIVTSTTPAGTTIRWYANNTATGSPIATPTTASVGTYYAFYYDATNNCKSPASAAVTVDCCPVLTPISN